MTRNADQNDSNRESIMISGVKWSEAQNYLQQKLKKRNQILIFFKEISWIFGDC